MRECGLKCASDSISGIVIASLPLRECGLKFRKIIYAVETGGVTPLAGVWIEISGIRANSASPSVTPLAGVWIEIYEFFVSFRIVPSLPLRECGLKSDVIVKVSFSSLSLPLRECGLKSSLRRYHRRTRDSHSPCGSVD